MPRIRSLIVRAAIACAAVVRAAAPAAAILLLVPDLSVAQRVREPATEQESTRATPTMRLSLFEALGEVQACIDAEDFACARERLGRLASMRGLTGYETAQIFRAYGTLHIAEERYRDAIAAFENLLKQEDVPLALAQQTLYTVAQLYGQEEDYASALDALERWFALTDTPSPDSWALKARFLYLLERYADAIEPARTALRLFDEQGRSADEGLYQVLQYAHLELEQFESAAEVGKEIVARWPKKQHVVTLAAVYGEISDELVQLALYETAFEAGWLTSSAELVGYAQLLLAAEIPYKAARILEEALEKGAIESTPASWDLLSQAWLLAQESERSLPALARAAELASNGEIDLRLASAYAAQSRWQDCVDAAERALERGLDRVDEAHVQRGSCLTGLKRFEAAREAFRTAARDPRSRDVATQWLRFVEAEELWGIELENMRDTARELERAAAAPRERP